MTNEMEEPEAKKMKAAKGAAGDEEMTVQFEDENGEGTSWDQGPNIEDHGVISAPVALK